LKDARFEGEFHRSDDNLVARERAGLVELRLGEIERSPEVDASHVSPAIFSVTEALAAGFDDTASA